MDDKTMELFCWYQATAWITDLSSMMESYGIQEISFIEARINHMHL